MHISSSSSTGFFVAARLEIKGLEAAETFQLILFRIKTGQLWNAQSMAVAENTVSGDGWTIPKDFKAVSADLQAHLLLKIGSTLRLIQLSSYIEWLRLVELKDCAAKSHGTINKNSKNRPAENLIRDDASLCYSKWDPELHRSTVVISTVHICFAVSVPFSKSISRRSSFLRNRK